MVFKRVLTAGTAMTLLTKGDLIINVIEDATDRTEKVADFLEEIEENIKEDE